MTSTEERISKLETRVSHLETWAGPGQVGVLVDGLREIRQVQSRHSRRLARLQSDVTELKSDVTELKSDVTELKSDVTELKSAMAEVLLRLPEPPSSG